MSKTAANDAQARTSGLSVERRYTTPGVHPFDQVEWELRDAVIGDPENPAFEQRQVEFPTSWSQNATNIVTQKYFRGKLGSPERESSVKQMISRVAGTIAAWGREGGYFATDEDADAFEAELTHILLHQEAAFNSPVWFNVGFEDHPQCSACFILSVQDTMESILDWNTKEGMIFRGGSGSGINLSNIRSSQEHLSKGGLASGPVSFMRGADAWAGTIKSGGKTRRAAKMVVLDVDHPDVEDFIWCKAREEEKAAALRDAGFDMRLDSDSFHSIQYQNANNSVRVNDEFMEAVDAGDDWDLHRPHQRRGAEDASGARADAPDRRRRLALRRPGRPVRHHDQPLAHLPGVGADQRLQPVLRVHARRRLCLQPGLDQPDEVPQPRRDLRGRELQPRGRRRLPRPGDRGRAVELPDRADRHQRPRLPPDRPRLRQPRRAPDVERAPLRLRARAGDGGGDHRADDRPRLPAVGRDRGAGRHLRRVRRRTASPTTP